jgi:hypothetical protein
MAASATCRDSAILGTSGEARPAGPRDNGLLAQGSDDPTAADHLARQIGLASAQMINPDQTLLLPIFLSLPSPVELELSCRPDGKGRRDGRDTLILACTGNRDLHVDDFIGELKLAGVQEIDIQSGVRVASKLSGRLDGEKLSDNNYWQSGNYRLFYSLDTDFD